MKKIFFLFLIATVLCSLWLKERTETERTGLETSNYIAMNHSYMKGMWLSQYDLYKVYTDGEAQREREDFKDRICLILDNIKGLGVNTIIVQVRPFGDSFYPSEYYPMSAYAVGAYGNLASYDPFKIIVEEAHERELAVHAWVNPLRGMRPYELEMIDGDYPIKEWYGKMSSEKVVEVSGRLYLNPAYSDVRSLVVNGVTEILRKYDVDGIHIDDYFYPTTDSSFDRAAYSEYLSGGGDMLLGDFRRNMIDRLVSEIYRAVKAENESVMFGVSPSGVMNNNYSQLYANVAKWCSEDGFVDYICPQVYFGFEHSTCPFEKVCDEFAEIVKNKNVRLVIGMSLEKAAKGEDIYAGEGKYEWTERKDILLRSMKKVSSIEKCDGVCLFSYHLFYDPVSGERVAETAEEIENLLPVFKSKSRTDQAV